MVGSGAGKQIKLIDAVKVSARAERSMTDWDGFTGVLCCTRTGVLSMLIADYIFFTYKFDCLLSQSPSPMSASTRLLVCSNFRLFNYSSFLATSL